MVRARRRIAVAMSGGVDSSVSAALLKQEGYDVIGFFAKTWTPREGDGTNCTWVAERRDALRVAAHLEIPLVTLDLEAEYRSDVVGPLVQGYARGETPNPDVLCNRVVKFDALWQAAQRYGVELLATGHYARIAQSPLGRAIARGRDVNKDQTYFLWDIQPVMLPRIRFPIGDYTKPQVRALAEQFGLPVAAKKDSQGICFLGPTDIQRFLDTYLGQTEGPIRDSATGAVIGRHAGVHHATIGQRHNIGAVKVSLGTTAAPLFVVDIDQPSQTLWVGHRSALYHSRLVLREANWLSAEIASKLTRGETVHVAAQVRYRQKPTEAEVTSVDGRLRVQFAEPVYAPAPGQSIVLYAEQTLLGGAIIEDVLDNTARLTRTKRLE